METIKVNVWEVAKGDSIAHLYENQLGTYIRGTDKLSRFIGKPMHVVRDYLLDHGCICTLIELDRQVAR